MRTFVACEIIWDEKEYVGVVKVGNSPSAEEIMGTASAFHWGSFHEKEGVCVN